jgi:protein phosphatase
MALQAFGANLELCAMQLVQMANDNGGRDNVSVILVKVRESFPAPKRGLGDWWQRVLGWFKVR